MANSASARKRIRQAERHRQHNVALRSRLRTAIKNVIKAVNANDKELAKEAYKKAVPLLDSSVNKNLIHRNKAARHKSRLNKLLRTS
ncbi:MAG: 30S ribosomal protein S20 [Gammaproteobacteria bacterium]|nr:30S ribosomal protein S20 [Gammaproteobacteria bacterium]